MTSLMMAVLIALGLWQLQRAAWKEALLAQYRLNAKIESQDLPALSTTPEKLEFQTVELSCQRTLPLVLRPGGSPEGRAGVHVYAPCIPETGPTIIIDYGWAPLRVRPSDLALPDGRRMFKGVVRVWPHQTWAERVAGAQALTAASFKTTKPIRTDIYIQATQTVEDKAPGKWGPIPSPLGVESIPNNHRSYAVQWFLFAVILALIYGLYVRRWRMLHSTRGGATVRTL